MGCGRFWWFRNILEGVVMYTFWEGLWGYFYEYDDDVDVVMVIFLYLIDGLFVHIRHYSFPISRLNLILGRGAPLLNVGYTFHLSSYLFNLHVALSTS